MTEQTQAIGDTPVIRGNNGHTGACSLANIGKLSPSIPRISPDISLNSSTDRDSYTPKTVICGPWPTVEKPTVPPQPAVPQDGPPPKAFHTTTLLGEPVTRERILRLLAAEPMQTAYALTKATGAPKATIKAALKMLESRRVVAFSLIESPHTKGNQLVRHYYIKP